MKKIIRFLIFTIILVQLSAIGFLYLRLSQKTKEIKDFEIDKFEKLNFIKNVTYDPSQSEINQMKAIPKQPINQDDLVIGGWLPDWDFNDAFASLKLNNKIIGSASPFLFVAQEDGSLKALEKTDSPAIVDYSKINNIELTPTITSFDADRISAILNNSAAMENHVDSIIKVTLDNDYDGIDLDYESFYLKDKEKYFEFLQKLSIKFTENNKKLVVTLHPKWGEKDVVYISFPETKRVMDYKRIADLVDEVRIMTYEFTGRDNIYYGPNMPLQWLEDVIRFAILSGIPRDKLVIGIATYSYDYPEKEKMPTLDYYPIFKNTFNPATAGLAYYNTAVDYIKNNFEYTEEFNNEWGEMVLRYTNEDGQKRIIVYPNAESIKLRKNLAADYGIRGIYFWRLGDEGTLIY